jgi:hypothetical protein
VKTLPTLAQIAKTNSRNALMVCFHNHEQIIPEPELCKGATETFRLVSNYLIKNNIPFAEAYPPLAKGTIAIPYLNSLYIDIEMNQKCNTYKALCNFLEDDSGSPRYPHLKFIYITPQLAANFE